MNDRVALVAGAGQRGAALQARYDAAKTSQGSSKEVNRRMPLTREENEGLVCVGPGTPAGELLRRYWLPISVARELTPEQPTKFVRVLGENLVLFRDTAGRLGLIQDR